MAAEQALIEQLARQGGSLGVLLYLAYELRRGRLADLDEKVTGMAIVIRAVARSNDQIDHELVDEYLAKNGVEPSDFIQADGGHREEAD